MNQRAQDRLDALPHEFIGRARAIAGGGLTPAGVLAQLRTALNLYDAERAALVAEIACTENFELSGTPAPARASVSKDEVNR